METSAISFRVADFLKKHPPFQAMEESDLLELAARGRVKFHEPNEYILWQGEPHRHQVFVIHQGTVSLWDEAASDAELRDVRGVGDMTVTKVSVKSMRRSPLEVAATVTVPPSENTPDAPPQATSIARTACVVLVNRSRYRR